ncbi:MAG: glycoside hydrolase family 16 protein [Anaeromyxobacter sp.]
MSPRVRTLALVLLPLLAGWGRCGGGPVEEPVPKTYELAWSDEFDGAAGELPDPSRWTFDVGGGGWGNAQLEYDTDRAENAALDGEGHLLITARRESYQGNAYTSARLKTQGRFSQQYGRFEARVQLPSGQGLWPAFWLLGANQPQVGWPACGEIDILEYKGQFPQVVHGSLHGPGYSGGEAITGSWSLVGSPRLDADFHVYAVEWDAQRIRWLVDGREYQTVEKGDQPGGAAWAYDHPFFVILNVAVGGYFVGAPAGATAFPTSMVVDYVRVYREVQP